MAEQAEQRRAGQIEESHYVDAALAVTTLEAGPADTAFLGYLYRARVDVLENFLARRIAKQRSMDQILNVGFFVFHSAWILFNCVGWMWRRTRPWQLATVSLTALSWFGLGIWYGWGYCPCTEWHWQVRARLGHHDPPSYLQLMIRELFGIDRLRIVPMPLRLSR